MSFCHQCGAEVQADDLFCRKCGEKQKHNQTNVTQAAGSVEPKQVKQQAPTELCYRGVGIRFTATIVDGLICMIIFWLVGSVVASMVGGTTSDGFVVEGTPAVVIQAVTVLLSILYFAVLECAWNGQTLGKKLVRIQVLKTDGSPVSFATALIRNILRLIDGFCFYLVAAISVWLSPTKQRIGDRIAKTCVVTKINIKSAPGRKKRKFKLTSKDDVYISDID